ncbi:hypothetical protein MSG28_006919 [Choristoneura fumiferana]|uniref:Uncharacterized protein n=1 Tax=Choristoneura fumiferana TaxID=7141 RepID=A0ACC0JLN0_CHOFU|nr:hypothetical protein MSG28_006919 [Choristoneura fumiferana]
MNNAENDSDSRTHGRNSSGASGYYSQAEKRAHHNALERKRRDHIKDSFTSLRDSVPALQGEKVASRAQILKKAAEYIQFMRRKNNSHQQDIDDLKRQNNLLESQIVVTGSIRPTVIFSWKRTTVEIQYNWWQLSEVIIYHIRALGQYKPLPTTTTEEPTTTTELTTTTTTKTTTRRWG